MTTLDHTFQTLFRLLPALLLSLAILLPTHPIQAAGNIQPVDRILVILNDDVITESELIAELQDVIHRLRERRTAIPPRATLNRRVLEQMIGLRLQLQLATKTGIRVDDDTLNKTLLKVARQNGMDLDGFRQALEHENYDFARFREKMRNEIIINRLKQREVKSRISVTEQEVEYMLANQSLNQGEYLLSHILIALPEGATPEHIQQARSRGEDILTRLRQGEDFATMAIAESQGSNALEGGTLGWRKMEQMPSLFADAVRSMKTGEFSELLRSPSGFHILKIGDYREGKRHLVDQTLARHILIQTNELTSAATAQERLAQIKERLDNGEDFAELARAHSADKGSAVEGGMLDWASPGDLVPQFEKVMNSLVRNQISEPFKTQFGWHIVQVLERRQKDATDALKRSQARKAIRLRKTDEEEELWLRRLRDESYIKYLLQE